MAHPHGLLHGRGVKELGAGSARDSGAAVLAHLRVTDLAAERHGRNLMAVAKAQDGKAQVKDGGVDGRSVLGVHGAGPPERMSAEAFISRISSAEMSQGTISEYTLSRGRDGQ